MGLDNSTDSYLHESKTDRLSPTYGQSIFDFAKQKNELKMTRKSSGSPESTHIMLNTELKLTIARLKLRSDQELLTVPTDFCYNTGS
jgi:hypothetical protein